MSSGRRTSLWPPVVSFLACLLVCNMVWAIPIAAVWNLCLRPIFGLVRLEPLQAYVLVLAGRGVICQWKEVASSYRAQ